jgi:5'-nucleotidase
MGQKKLQKPLIFELIVRHSYGFGFTAPVNHLIEIFMKILLSNDDGYDSPGILQLFHRLEEDGYDVTIVAPSRERSTAGHSLTLHKPLRIAEMGRKIYAVSGSPADSVYMATRQILGEKPSLVISGVNRGANLGTDIFYSGTVAAAREAFLFGIPSLAVSLCFGFPGPSKDYHWETSVQFISDFIRRTLEGPGLNHWLININVPNLPHSDLRKALWTTQGRRYYSDEIISQKDPRGRPYYWVGSGYTGFDSTENSDCWAVSLGHVSLTPLTIDTTDIAVLKNLSSVIFE